jgi:hypothetical protein
MSPVCEICARRLRLTERLGSSLKGERTFLFTTVTGKEQKVRARVVCGPCADAYEAEPDPTAPRAERLNVPGHSHHS